MGFDDVINNELSGVFIRNDTNSEVIKLPSLGLPGGATNREKERENVCVRSQIPSLGSKRDFSPWAAKKSEKRLLPLRLQRRGGLTSERRDPGKGFSFRERPIRSANRVNHPWPGREINNNWRVNLFPPSRHCRGAQPTAADFLRDSHLGDDIQSFGLTIYFQLAIDFYANSRPAYRTIAISRYEKQWG